MPLEIRPATLADMPTFTRVACDAITDPAHGNPGGEFIRACWPRMNTPAGRENAQLRFSQMLEFMPPGSVMKAVDTDDGDRLVGVAIWSTYMQQPGGYPPLELGEFWESGEEEEYGKYVWDQVMSEFLREYAKLSTPLMALEILCTDPAHYRQGIGSLLTKEGLARADALNAPVFVNATSRAANMYQKLGFEILPGNPHGFDRVEKYADKPGAGVRCMVRPKQA